MRIGIVVTIWNYLRYNRWRSFPYYIDLIFESFNDQDINGTIDVLFVDNQSHEAFQSDLRDRCVQHSNEKVSFSCVTEPEYQYHFSSMNLGFYILNNHAHYDYFGYSADDVYLMSPGSLSKALAEFSDPEVALVSSKDNFDHAPIFYPWYNDSKRMKVRLGECLNLQFILFSREYMEAYDFRYPDMLTCFGSESLLTYFCSAIDKSWISCGESPLYSVKVDNKKILRKKKKGQAGWFTATEVSIQDFIEPGLQYGMGFQGFVDTDLIDPAEKLGYVYGKGHDVSLYDEKGKCKHRDELYKYIKNYLFVKRTSYKERFDRIRFRFLNMKES